MSTVLQFVVPGPPVGKQRARTFRHKQSGRIISMTPAKTVNYEALIKQTFAAKYPGFKPLATMLSLRMNVHVLPSRVEEKLIVKWEAISKALGHPAPGGLPAPTKKPDLDNVIKVVADALKGLAYTDDKNICHISVEKLWADPDARVDVTLVFPMEESRGEAA